MWNVEDLMIDADMRGDDGSYEAVVDTLAALGDDARKARKESEPSLECICSGFTERGILNVNPRCPQHGLIEHLGKPYTESERGDAEPTQAARVRETPAGVAATAARSEQVKALRQLRERLERTMAHAQDTQRWIRESVPFTAEAVWRLSDAQRHLLRARNAVWAAEEKMRNG